MKRTQLLVLLVALGMPGVAFSQTYWAIENSTDQLVRIDIGTLTGTVVGSLGVNWQFGGIGFDSAGTLFGWNQINDSLYRINTATGAATLIGAGTQGSIETMDIHPVSGRAFGHSVANNSIYEIDLATGATTLVAATSPATRWTSSAFSPTGTWFGHDLDNTTNLFTIDPLTGAATSIGPLTGYSGVKTNLGFNQADGLLYTISVIDANFPLWSINPATGAATFLGNVSGLPGGGSQQITAGTFQFAPIPEPTTVALLGAGVAGASGGWWWRRQKKSLLARNGGKRWQR